MSCATGAAWRGGAGARGGPRYCKYPAPPAVPRMMTAQKTARPRYLYGLAESCVGGKVRR
jgi:hypothetical protein